MTSNAKQMREPSIRQLSVSEMQAVAGGTVKTPPVCKPTYPPPGSAATTA